MEVKQLLTSRQFKPATGVQKRAVRGYVSVKGDKAGDKAAAAEHAAVERDYIYNLQQQVYLLELELQTLRAQGPPAPASEDVVPGLNSQIAVLKEGKVRAEFGEVFRTNGRRNCASSMNRVLGLTRGLQIIIRTKAWCPEWDSITTTNAPTRNSQRSNPSKIPFSAWVTESKYKSGVTRAKSASSSR